MSRPTILNNITPVRDNFEATTVNAIGTGDVVLTISIDPVITEGIIELNYPTNPSKNETMKFTANTGGALTITAANRGLGGSAEQAHTATGVTVTMPYSEEIHKTIDDALTSKMTIANPEGLMTDGTFDTGVSDTTIPSSLAVQTYVQAQVVGGGGGSGSGDVIGDTSSTDHAIVRMNGITGKIIQTSDASIDDNGTINIPAGQTYQVDGTAYKGNVENYGIASEVEAQGGTASDKYMTPERTNDFFEANSLTVDITVDPAGNGDYANLTDAINAATEGDTIFVKSGNYTITGTPSLPLGCQLFGENKHDTVITGAFSIAGSSLSSSGTVALTNGSATVTGTGTTFTAGMVGNYIILGNEISIKYASPVYKIASVVSITEITLETVYEGVSLSAEEFSVGAFSTDSSISNVTLSASTITMQNTVNTSFNNCIMENTGNHITGQGTFNKSISFNSCDIFTGIVVNQTVGVAINTYFTDCRLNDLDVVQGSTFNDVLTDCVISGCEVDLGDNSIVNTCQISNAAAFGIDLGDEGKAVNNHLYNCTDGISMRDGSVITGNTIDTSTTGIEISGADSECVVTGNVIKDCTTGIDISGDNCIISLNVTKDCTTGVTNTGTGNTVANNIDV